MDKKRIDREFVYLTYLTKEKLKPLSRWENGFDRQHINLLADHGLKSQTITRKLRNGTTKSELIFSRKEQYLKIYQNNFDYQPLTRSYHEQLKEGKLFGYPLCCVENFIENGYTENEFVGQGQELLFHWACPECKLTPRLIPVYREIYEQVYNRHKDKVSQTKLLKKAAITALVSITLSFNTKAQNPHMLPVSGDDDGNNLNYKEAILFGYHALYQATDTIAIKYHDLISKLPTEEREDSCYRIEYKMRGVIPCPICGEDINMGYFELHNPMRKNYMDIDYMALHFMKNGSFSYGDSTDNQRINTDTLKMILDHYDDSHDAIAPVTGKDTDHDGLHDSLESCFEYSKNNRDSNSNHLLDGAELAEKIIFTIAQLPVVKYGEKPPAEQIFCLYYQAGGSERCTVCGASMNMGEIKIINPMDNSEIKLPIIALHYLAHGRLIYSGTEHADEINILRLAEVLGIKTYNPHLVIFQDDNKNYLTDTEETMLGYKYEIAFNELPDDSISGPLSAKYYYRLIKNLPEYQTPEAAPQDSCYKIRYDMDGLVTCPICGQEFAMGALELHNPMRDFTQNISYMGMHFLKHGSFSFGYALYSNYKKIQDRDRIDVSKLKIFFNHLDHSHDSIFIDYDSDHDGLVDSTEKYFGMDNSNLDSDDNQLLDGAQAAERLIEKIVTLPVAEDGAQPIEEQIYINFLPVYGLENCNICGHPFNMGTVEMVNTSTDISYSMPIIGLHYLAHGRFAYSGTTNEGQIDVAKLYEVLEDVSTIRKNSESGIIETLNLKYYPNPFNSQLKIEFEVPNERHINLSIYDIRGHKIKTIVNDKLDQGAYQKIWDGSNEDGLKVSSGIYFLRVMTNNKNIIKRIVFIQ